MFEPVYKKGMRVEKTLSPWFGIGFVNFAEVGLVISFYKWEITIGKVFK